MSSWSLRPSLCFFFTHTSTTEIYTLSLHDALPIFRTQVNKDIRSPLSFIGTLDHCAQQAECLAENGVEDRKSTRLNSSHLGISYAVFCLKKKKDTPEEGGPTSASWAVSRQLRCWRV